jgi:serine/threonine-protein kinase RsbW
VQMHHMSRAAVDLHLEMPANAESVAVAREAVRCCHGVSPEMLDDLVIVVSELMTNAVCHAGLTEYDEVQLALTFLDDAVHVEVADRGPGFDPSVVEMLKGSVRGGFGLHIVAALSRAWGVIPGAGVVWADVPL